MGLGTVLLIVLALLLLFGVGIPVLYLVTGVAKLILLVLLVLFVLGLILGGLRGSRRETGPAT